MSLSFGSNRSAGARRAVAGVLTAAALTGVVVGTAPVAAADDPPNCTAADLAGVAAGVSAAMSAYLFTHPDVNAFATSLKGQPRDEVQAMVQQWSEAHPQERAEIKAIRQPLADLRNRCGGLDNDPVADVRGALAG